ncbi:MAG: Asp23/Gls24 family envelope stress response protein [Oscillospiraceae bacterium]|jgi:uncharacterized alkaline shock family protein YloU|nr:Asp23/Gls24 family envelope stress response protein [Oscillospiraceae bacterium]
MKNENNPVGGLVISEEVIAQIASTAALEIPGVQGLKAKPANVGEVISLDSHKGIRVRTSEDVIRVDVYLTLKLGAKIREVSEGVQRSVKENVQNMTGRVVDSVNVHIEDIDLSAGTPE